MSPPLSVQEALTRELQMAFDDLPEHEKPEKKAKLRIFNDFGQHKLNLDNASHNYVTQFASLQTRTERLPQEQ